jgi:hypothetical protein
LTHALATACDGEVLARESCGDDASFWNKSCCEELGTGDLRDVVEQGGVGELVGEYSAGCFVDLDGGGDVDAVAFHGEVDAADPGK